MGTRYQFTCPSCGYRAEVSGGDDAGMHYITTTITCEAFQELLDTYTASINFPDGSDTEFPLECPNGRGHRLKKWTSPGPCPRCGATMKKGEAVMWWD